ncbi:Glycosyl transferase family 2 [Roseivivax jejudonensis]|uniref:Glycosyl transferase family 2 n=1 Tax=Roseivivax jejudonensis TaxID=1529041 RepID=A0A1X6YJ86_9RHOB|nr:glycosyltransferase [Roseivivax jejudonensis]SLN22390.1 Glycosyl transferase family 2 [Roseivivax jejudonensis]
MSVVDLVLIGRNEGARLRAALASAKGQARRLVYVDSGSTDDSVEAARAAGADVVTLDMSVPFTAARARNAGAWHLLESPDPPDYLQFIDGDCAIVAGWIADGADRLDAAPELGLVTGWRAETAPESSVYNHLCHWEWRRPAGEIRACGGDMLVRAAAFRAIDGFDPTVIAAEDDEFCARLRKAGWRLERLPREMTRHDAAMTRFGQWWRRAERTGHGFAQVGHLHPDTFVTERRRVVVYALALPLAVGAALVVAPWVAAVLVLAYPLNWSKSTAGLRRDGIAPDAARRLGLLLTLSKFPNLIGMARFHLRRMRRAPMRLIEYK